MTEVGCYSMDVIISAAVLLAAAGCVIWMLYFSLRSIKCYRCGEEFRAYKLESVGITEDASCYMCKKCERIHYGR